MSLKPRYSLLTLLILTAFIAGGIKLWRGPHHVVIPERPNEEERLLVDQFLFRGYFNGYYPPVVYEYEYVNSLNEREYLYVKGRSTGERPIPVYRLRFSSPQRAYLITELNLRSIAAQNEPHTDEQVVCWMYHPKSKELAAAELPAPAVPRHAGLYGCYFLTNRKQLYRCNDDFSFGIPLDRVELSQIEGPELRQCVAAELEKISVAP